ncbi:MAG: hypothetical protein EOM20_02325 [Spartobacteria bacterium]|nr:hypothetical protein [Spartobacteria bacterium]
MMMESERKRLARRCVSHVQRWLYLLAGKHRGKDELQSLGFERMRRVLLTGISGVGATGLISLVSLISIPLTVRYLGTVRYGVWVIVNSMLTWLTVSNMGLAGAALVTTLAHALGLNDIQKARQLISSSIFILCLMALLMGLVLFLCFPLIPWMRIVNAEGLMSADELNAAIMTAAAFFLLMFPLSTFDAVYSGFQEGYIMNVWNVGASVLSLLALIVVTRMEGGLPLLIVALFGSRLLIAAVNLFYLFGYLHPEVRPSWRTINMSSIRELLGLGWKYMAQQLAGMGMYQVQPLLITRFLGPEQVGIFNIAQRLLTIPLLFVQMFSMPLVPAYGEARARADWGWIQRTLRRSVWSSLFVAGALILPIAFVLPWLCHLWMGAHVQVDAVFIGIMSLYILVNASITPIAVFFSGFQWMGSQAVIALANTGVNVLLALYMLRFAGLSGMAWSMLAGILANAAGQCISLLVFRKTTEHIDGAP